MQQLCLEHRCPIEEINIKIVVYETKIAYAGTFSRRRSVDGKNELIKTAKIDPLQVGMIKIRASQINGCAYCMNKHIGDALKLGEDPQRVYVLSGWREARNWFNEEEQTILQLTEEITLISNGRLSDEVYDKAEALFGASRLTAIVMTVVSINAWNRVGVALRMHPIK